MTTPAIMSRLAARMPAAAVGVPIGGVPEILARRLGLTSPKDRAAATLAAVRCTLASALPASAPVLRLAGEIGPDCPISLARVEKFLAGIGPQAGFRIRLTSEGGSVVEAERIAARIRAHRGAVEAHVPIKAHSAAGLILAAADRRTAAPGARLLLHHATLDPPRGRMTAARLTALANLTAAADQRIAAALAGTGMPKSAVAQCVARGAELTAVQAHNLGLVDEVKA
ncbi:ATP-dependent protease ClpP protease subunit [Constrictibacter sp. MBR-5]|uniref:ATP-dependent Clp protease proteolytic subunit n=1 Tax=Constrictibacter sp. MBR-5 TaxID=3156467 RepID=UPI0033969997